MRPRGFLGAVWLVVLLACGVPSPAAAQRVRDLGQFHSVRTNQLTGYGIVVGLDGSGDDNLAYLTQAMRGVSGRLGLHLLPGVNPALKNAAAVIITAELPAFAKPGQRIDVTVSTIGKAKSLRGGALILTPLYGADGAIYAMAQGNLAVGGLGVSGKDGSKLTVNVPTVGRIADGATVEAAVPSDFALEPVLRWNLLHADFLTMIRVRDAINAMYPDTARIEDGVTLAIDMPEGSDARAQVIARIEMLEIKPAERAAKVVINARTGTIVISSAVRLAPAAISHGSLMVRVDESPLVVQPGGLSRGRTATEQSSTIALESEGGRVSALAAGASLAEVVDALNALGASPADLVAILEGLKQAGSLTAELVIL